MNYVNTRFDFSSPFVPSADPIDGLLKTADINEPVRVDITVWDAVRPGYYVQLLLNDNLIGSARTFSEDDQPGDIISLTIDTDHLMDSGTYTLSYRATNNESGVHNDSPQVRLLVDRNAPGAAMLAAIVFPSASFGEHLIGRIPGYAGMQAGDLIQSLCNSIAGPSYLVTAEDVTATVMEIRLPRDYLETLDSKVTVAYQVTDRAGNNSILSEPVELTLQR